MPSSPDQSQSVYEVEFSLFDRAYPFVGVSAAEQCRFELAEMLPRDDHYAEFFCVRGAPPRAVLDHVDSRDGVEIHLHRERDDGGLFEFLVADDCPAYALAELGALPRQVQGVDGQGTIVAEIPGQYDATAIVDAFTSAFPDAELDAKRHKTNFSPFFARSAFAELLETKLTARQREVLEAAFEAGYYEWPRECSGSELAADLGISSSTFSQHIHAAERKLLEHVFERRR